MSDISPTKDRLFRDLEKLVNAPAGSLRGDLPIKDLQGWDSLAILEFMVLASENNRDLQPADIARCKTVDDLVSLVLTGTTQV